MSVKLPETLVLFATVHGVIPVNRQDGTALTFQVPEGMSVTRVMATRPGICNMTTNDEINKFVKLLKKLIESEIVTSDEGLSRLQALIKKEYEGIYKSVFGQLKGESPDQDLNKQYVESSVSIASVNTFDSGTEMLEKFLARDSKEGQRSRYDYKLNMMNVDGIPDLFNQFILTPEVPYPTRSAAAKSGRGGFISDIFGMLKFQGVRNVVFIDFTCSSFEDGILTARGERAARNQAIKEGRGRRRRTRRPKNKTKTRKGKKRTVSKWRR